MELEEYLREARRDMSEREKEIGKEFAERFLFRRLSNNQKKALRDRYNQTVLWATSGVD